MQFTIELISPPDREQPAEINQEQDRPMLELDPRRDGNPWVVDYEEAIAALVEAKRRLLGA